MTTAILRCLNTLTRHAILRTPALRRMRGDSFNMAEIAFLKAACESADYYESQFPVMRAFRTDLDLLSEAVSVAPQNGLFLEFGVATGRTIRHIASRVRSRVYGFDSFRGLPSDWRTGFEKDRFAGSAPTVPENVSLIEGWFSESLPKFLEEHLEDASFIHVDCDLYSSAKCALDALSDRIVKGTVIQFDEYWNYPGWKAHEFRAFDEFKAASSITFKPIGFVPDHQQVAFVAGM
jgi:Macrocin-O-methyltransferase (TylF)